MAASRRTSPAPAATQRRVIPIKRADGEPLTRVDIQYDFLQAVFDNTQEVFSDPYAAGTDGKKLTFRELYIKAILNSPKATKALKDKLNESPTFTLDFAMLALLVNVGRVNTTMSFFPEMKTAIRTYHPIPSLQRTNGNMQDAPRIKHILKMSLLAEEATSPPATPADILARCKTGPPPSTSVTNLIFVLAHHTGPIGQAHFNGRIDFLDLFLRPDVSSASRAKAFLWLCYNYLESPSSEDDYDEEPSPNPFADSSKQFSPPSITTLTPEEVEEENQEPPEEVALAQKLILQRNRIIHNQATKVAEKASNKASLSGSVAGDDEDPPLSIIDEVKAKGKRNASSASVKIKGKQRVHQEKKPTTSKPTKEVSKPRHSDRMALDFDLDDDDDDAEEDTLIDALLDRRHMSSKQSGPEPAESFSSLFPSRIASQPIHRRSTMQSESQHNSKSNRYSPYGSHNSKSTSPVKDTHRSRHNGHPRNMLQQAWKAISSTDPLVDSDDEVGGDEFTRQDYIQRLKVINQLSQQRWPYERSPYSSSITAEPN
ncbi:Ino eighty subunit 1 [Psilocybe cubensis]|uniref:Ino eighty subunit 1 n=2 Tax=Psilocybe cubensis TaxID=181762 RepID=A0A8H7YAN9_PSICU|nr:Ino eighty subunit 1 [Psilocybe cubensis]KAH9486740.1 Ino eighty subunit 1 [Psilocybe cubensis]